MSTPAPRTGAKTDPNSLFFVPLPVYTRFSYLCPACHHRGPFRVTDGVSWCPRPMCCFGTVNLASVTQVCP